MSHEDEAVSYFRMMTQVTAMSRGAGICLAVDLHSYKFTVYRDEHGVIQHDRADGTPIDDRAPPKDEAA